MLLPNLLSPTRWPLGSPDERQDFRMANITSLYFAVTAQRLSPQKISIQVRVETRQQRVSLTQ
jgi:hypothetical protein